jgi:acyl-CoA dehydrogenase
MDLSLSPAAQALRERLTGFLDEHVYPAEAEYTAYRRAAGPDDHTLAPVVERLTATARSLGLWNLFLPALSGLSNVEYAQLTELTGRSPYLAPQAMNCAAPDTGNMELLHLFGTDEQKDRWLAPLLDGRIRSGFSMTEPDVASSDARNVRTSIVRQGSEYVINGRKWWTTGVADPRCAVLIVMGKTDPAPAHRQQSMILVPVGTPACGSCGPCRSSASTTRTGTARSPSPTCASRSRT